MVASAQMEARDLVVEALRLLGDPFEKGAGDSDPAQAPENPAEKPLFLPPEKQENGNRHENEHKKTAPGHLRGEQVERYGQENPHGLKGDELHEYAKMIGLLDLYEALTHSRPNRERIGFFEAVKYLCQSCKTRFERRHLKAFLRGFTVFPLQSHVLLNSGAVGLVVKTHGDQPLRPEVRMLLDSQGRHVLTERVVRLPAEPLLHIVRCVSEKELARLLQGASASELAPEKGWEEAAGPLF